VSIFTNDDDDGDDDDGDGDGDDDDDDNDGDSDDDYTNSFFYHHVVTRGCVDFHLRFYDFFVYVFRRFFYFFWGFLGELVSRMKVGCVAYFTEKKGDTQPHVNTTLLCKY